MRLHTKFSVSFVLALLLVALTPTLSFAQGRARRVEAGAGAPVRQLSEGRSASVTLPTLTVVIVAPFDTEDSTADVLDDTITRPTQSAVHDDAGVAALNQRLKPSLSPQGRDGTSTHAQHTAGAGWRTVSEKMYRAAKEETADAIARAVESTFNARIAARNRLEAWLSSPRKNKPDARVG